MDIPSNPNGSISKRMGMVGVYFFGTGRIANQDIDIQNIMKMLESLPEILGVEKPEMHWYRTYAKSGEFSR